LNYLYPYDGDSELAESQSVESIMKKNVITVRPFDSLQIVQSLMKRYGITRVVVVDENEKAVGVLTQKDFVWALSDDKTGRGIDEISTSEVMTETLITVSPETEVTAIAKMITKEEIGSLVIVDGEGKPQGIVTKTDLCLWYSKTCPGYFKVKHVMTQNVVTVKPTAFVFHVIDLMNVKKIRRVIVAKNNEPVGMIAVADLAPLSTSIKPLELSVSTSAWILTASNVMTADPLVVKLEDDLCEAARVMLANRISGLPVVNEKGKLTGIITKTDIVKAILDLP
jgi:CBS domain-containing protein